MKVGKCVVKINDLNKSFLDAFPIIEKIEDNGYEAYFVGGSVRDALLNKSIHDVDIATSALPEEMKQLFKRTIDIGIEHGTVMVLYEEESYEVTTFRTESTYLDFRRPESVHFVRSLEEDLKRRDFTINALAMSKDGHVIDYFNGLEDLKAERIKAVGDASERFHEDALRMMRAVRFVSQLQFTLEDLTKAAVKEHSGLLEKIAVERIQIEFVKLLLGPGRKEGMTAFIETDLFTYCPGLKNKEKELSKLAEVNGQIESSDAAWTLLVYFLQLEPKEINRFMRAWKCSKKEINTVTHVYEGLLQRKDKQLSNLQMYQLGLDHAILVEIVAKHLNLPSNIEETISRFHMLPIKEVSELAVTGTDIIKDLDQKPGKWLGDLLNQLQVKVVEERLDNDKDTLLAYAKQELNIE